MRRNVGAPAADPPPATQTTVDVPSYVDADGPAGLRRLSHGTPGPRPAT
ncbi:hypothetical protein AB0K00_08930 [Dactylosporangium sp. NPDC049525]